MVTVASGAPPGAPATARRVRQASSELARLALERMAAELPFFPDLPAALRASIGLVVQDGVSAFSNWLDGAHSLPALPPVEVFAAAPRDVLRAVSLQRTVEMVRVAVDAVESRVDVLAEPDAAHWLREGLLRYSRDVAFAAAQIYAQAAEARGAWDARLEALLVDGLLRRGTSDDPNVAADLDDELMSRAAALGWRPGDAVAAIVGGAPAGEPEAVLRDMHRTARQAGADLLAGAHGNDIVALVGTPDDPLVPATRLLGCFRPGPVVLGPVVVGLAAGARSARVALAGLAVADAWPSAPRPVHASDLLPERALAGDLEARDELLARVHAPLVNAGGDLLETVAAYLESAGSVDGAARLLYVHANTVRYRLRRVAELTGQVATEPRGGFVLHVALVHGRLRTSRTTTALVRN